MTRRRTTVVASLAAVLLAAPLTATVTPAVAGTERPSSTGERDGLSRQDRRQL